MREVNYDKVPAPHMVEGVRHWIEDGLCGDFLRAVVNNDLREAVARADGTNVRLIREWVSFFYNEAPSDCWGSPEKAAVWAAARQAVRAAREANDDA